jgi:hypothetical protein
MQQPRRVGPWPTLQAPDPQPVLSHRLRIQLGLDVHQPAVAHCLASKIRDGIIETFPV